MHKKSVIFGIGIGILAMVLVSLVAYNIQRASHRDEVARLLYALEYERNNPPPQPDWEHLIESMPHENTPEPMPTPEPTPVPQYDPPEEPEPITLNPIDEPTVPEEPQSPQSPQSPSGYVWVHIPVNIAATEIVNILGDAGVVENRAALLVFLVDNNFDRTVMAGNFLMPVNASFQEILDIILL